MLFREDFREVKEKLYRSLQSLIAYVQRLRAALALHGAALHSLVQQLGFFLRSVEADEEAQDADCEHVHKFAFSALVLLVCPSGHHYTLGEANLLRTASFARSMRV